MPTKLKNLIITKVALVDEGSCSAAHIKLYKRKEGGNVKMNFDELLKSLPTDQQGIITAEIEKAKKDASDKTAADMEDMMDQGVDDALENPDGTLTDVKNKKKKTVTKVATKVKELQGKIAKLKGSQTDNEEELFKNMDPAVKAIILKDRAKAVAAEAVVKKLQDDNEQKESLAKAKELPNIAADENELAKSFRKMKNTDPDMFEHIFGVFKAANELIAAGNGLGSTGSAGEGDAIAKAADAAWVEIEQKADEIKKADGCTKEMAIAKAVKANPELYKKYLTRE